MSDANENELRSMLSKITSGPSVATSPVPFVKVQAPADLPQGYVFEAIYDGQTFSVTVPKGGVVKGEQFDAPFVPHPPPHLADSLCYSDSIGENASNTFNGQPSAFASSITMTNNTMNNNTAAMNDVPVIGHWKDGLCDCCRHGPFHPSFLLGFFCYPVLIAQVMTRLKLNWLGEPAPLHEWKRTFRRVVIIFLIHILLLKIVHWGSTNYLCKRATLKYLVNYHVACPEHLIESRIQEGDNEYFEELKKRRKSLNAFEKLFRPTSPMAMAIVNNLAILAVFSTLYFWFITMRTRQVVRKRYQIPDSGIFPVLCRSCEDLCCAIFCRRCTAAQLARHTADYKYNHAMFVSETGLLPTNPILVV